MNACTFFPKVVLLSEDRGLRRQLHRCLAALGLTAETLATVRSAQECYFALARMRPYLVVVDDGLAGLDAQDLLRAVRWRANDVLIVYLATHHTTTLERAVRQLGVLYYAEKPPDLNRLGKILDAALASAAGGFGDREHCWGKPPQYTKISHS